MRKLPPNIIPSELIHWDHEHKIGTAEISELVGNGVKFIPKDFDVSVSSSVTGKLQKFFFKSFDLDASNEDIAGRRYTSKINGQEWTLLIIND